MVDMGNLLGLRHATFVKKHGLSRAVVWRGVAASAIHADVHSRALRSRLMLKIIPLITKFLALISRQKQQKKPPLRAAFF
jgi:hypothetical protein